MKRLALYLLGGLLMSHAHAFTLSSTDFSDGDTIPTVFTCKGKNLPPMLRWSDPPANTQSYVLIMDDPDAPNGTWTHWVLYNIPPTSNEISQTTRVGTPGVNSAFHERYDGPCPPSGVHRYIFTLYALDTLLTLPPHVMKKTVLHAMDTHVLGSATLTGTVESR